MQNSLPGQFSLDTLEQNEKSLCCVSERFKPDKKFETSKTPQIKSMSLISFLIWNTQVQYQLLYQPIWMIFDLKLLSNLLNSASGRMCFG